MSRGPYITRTVAAAWTIAFAACCVAVGAAWAGYVPPSAMPSPAASAPPSEVIGGAVGTDTSQYALANHSHPRITRAAAVVTDGSGNWSVTWSTALASTPIALPIPINAGSQPAMCNVTSVSTTGASGKCWMAATTVLNLSIVTAGLTLNGFAGSASGLSVQVIAIPTTQ